jgi:nucleotide-binding universal stress UspA family protein
MKRFVVLVGIDLSSPSAAVADQALDLAATHPRSEVHFVAVQELTLELAPTAHDEIRSPVAALRQITESAVRRFEASHAISSLEKVTVHAMVGDPAREIVALAAELGADLVLVGTHGRRGVKRVLLGSVAEKVVRTAGCPVFVVRPKAHAEALKVPEIEPLCSECAGTREASGGRELWCARHAEHHVHAHVYSYDQVGHGETRPWGFST